MARFARGSFLLSAVFGVLITALGYQLLPFLPDPNGLVARYLTGHPLEYVIAGLAVVACVELAVRVLTTSSRRHQIVDAEDRIRLDSSADDWRTVAADATDVVVTRRLTTFADLRDRDTRGVVEHATRLSDRAADDLAGSYAPLMTILWAIPIVGFLGTVMGITIAVANISPDQLENSLGSVTSGLAVAFDTTALALALSLMLGFATLFVRRQEERLLGRLDDFCDAVLVPAFPQGPAGGEPALAIVDATSRLLAEQMTQWNKALDEQRAAFAQSLESGHRHFVEAWADIQVNAIESQKLNWEASTDQMGDAMADWQARFEQSLETIAAAVPQIAATVHEASTEQLQQTLHEIRTHSTTTTERLAVVSDTLATRAESTESLIARCEQLAADVASATAEQNRDWNDIASKTGALTEMQRAINEQLTQAGVAEQLDDTLHQLTAAVHLLTARSRAA